MPCRFYGESIPKCGLSVDCLKYLSTSQALADAALLINTINKQSNTSNSKWVAFGGSYSGALSTWFRVLYPELTVAALSSSGVVNAVLEFENFDISNALAEGEECASAVRLVTSALERLLAGIDDLRSKHLFPHLAVCVSPKP